MNYITSQEAADKWGITRRSVQLYCQEGKIPGAINPGKQWLIPENAAKPSDNRLEKNKKSMDVEAYHFPVFVYSRCFLSISELSEDECLLHKAQLLNLKSEFTQSVILCRRLINETTSPGVRFGAWFTNYSNFMLLGLASQLPDCINAMEQILNGATSHREDYRLLLAFLEQTYRFDRKRYLTIDVTKLSPDAITTYELIALAVAYFSVEDIAENTIKFFEAACRKTDLLGIAPASLSMHCLIGMLHSRRGNMEAKLLHIDEACRIGYENGITRLLAKCSSLDIDTFYECLSKYGDTYASDIRNRCIQNRNNWKLAYVIHAGNNPTIDVNLFEAEIIVLLIYKTPIENIAMLKNITSKEVRKTIREICTRLSLKSTKELIKLFKATYFSTPDTEFPLPLSDTANNTDTDTETK